MKKLFVVLVLYSSLFLYGITENQLIQMQNRGELIVGRGEAETDKEADKLALQDLASQIVVKISSSFIDIAKEENSEVEEYCESVVKTISEITLSNAGKFCTSSAGNKVVYRYITPEDRDRIFAERKTQILSLVSEGEIAEDGGDAVDAIRNYYWALMLLKTHPDKKTMTYYFRNHDRVLYSALINQIEGILSEINIEISSVTDVKDSNCRDYVLYASYHGKPADGILIKYHDGYEWSGYERWNNGKGYFSINKSMAATMDYIKLNIDCSFSNHGFSGEIKETLSTMQAYDFNNSSKVCELARKKPKKVKSVKSMVSYEKEIPRENIQVMEKVIEAISGKDIATSRRHFTAKGFRDFNELIGYGDAEILPEQVEMEMLKFGKLRVLRSIPLKFNFRTSNEDFTEKVNFVFNEEDKVDGVTFSLSDTAIKDIMTKDYGTDEEKALIVNFVEQYKTAYCLKDTSFIQDVFCDDALIIVGRVVQRKPDDYSDKLYQQLGDELIEYITLEKSEYIDRLTKQFEQKEFINIHFSDNEIEKVQSRGSKVYGMQIGQYYYSSDYRDKGYLFLMFDLENPDEPKIMVRSWQPEKAADGSIIGVSNFQFE